MFDAEEQSKYREFKEQKGCGGLHAHGQFSHYLQDHYTAGPVNGSLSDECEILVVGAGFADYYLVQAQAAGFVDVRFCEKEGLAGPGTGIVTQGSLVMSKVILTSRC